MNIFELLQSKKKVTQQISELQYQVDGLKSQKVQLEKNMQSDRDELGKIRKELFDSKTKLNEINNKINVIEVYEEYGIKRTEDSLDRLQSMRYYTQNKLDAEISNGLYDIIKPYKIDGSVAKGKELQSAFANGMVHTLSCYIDEKAKSCKSVDSTHRAIDLIRKKFDTLQKKSNKIGISLNERYMELRIDLMDYDAQIVIAEKAEKARLREEKKRARDAEKAMAEAEAEQRRLEKEREAMNVAYGKALTDEERQEIKEKLQSIDKRIDDVKYRCTHYKCGFLYVITSSALPNMVKVGATRRLPYMRVKELSSSSLPFPFKLDAYCFCDDVFDIEAKAHRLLDGKRVNADREFFYATVGEAVSVLENQLGQNVRYGVQDNEGDDGEVDL